MTDGSASLDTGGKKGHHTQKIFREKTRGIRSLRPNASCFVEHGLFLGRLLMQGSATARLHGGVLVWMIDKDICQIAIQRLAYQLEVPKVDAIRQLVVVVAYCGGPYPCLSG